MNDCQLLTPTKAERLLAQMPQAPDGLYLEVSEEQAFSGQWLPMGTVLMQTSGDCHLPNFEAIRQGAFEWTLPSAEETSEGALTLLGAKASNNKGKLQPLVDMAIVQVASAAARLGLINPRFDPAAVSEMPFHRATTVVVDTSAVIQGALDFVDRFLHPDARIKVPAITHMEIANMTDRFLSIRRSQNKKPQIRAKELREHLISQGGQRALLRLELRSDTEVERTYLLGDPLRAAFARDTDGDLRDLNISSPQRSYADRLILEAARHHQAQSEAGHAVRLLTGDQGLARMALAEGIRPLYFTALGAADVFGQRLTGQTFHPFSGLIHRTPLIMVLWELATAFGSARLRNDRDDSLQVCAIGKHLSWTPYHAEQDLLWCRKSERSLKNERFATSAEQIETKAALRLALSGSRVIAARSPAKSSALLRFNVEKLFRLICALDDQQALATTEVEKVTQTQSAEYRRFLQSGGLIDFVKGRFIAQASIQPFAVALRNEAVEEVRKLLLQVPSFSAFFERIESLGVGSPLDQSKFGRGASTYKILGEVTLVCASIFGKGTFATPSMPTVEEFSKVALHQFSSLDREGQGLVDTGAWLESLIEQEGIHPEVAIRLLDEASGKGLLRRSTEGSTTQFKFANKVIHVLRIEEGLPVVKAMQLYRGDYLIPGTASVSLRIEAATS